MSGEVVGFLWIGPPLILVVLSNLLFGTNPGARHVMTLMLVASAVELAIWLTCSLLFGVQLYWMFLVQWTLLGGFALWNLRRSPS